MNFSRSLKLFFAESLFYFLISIAFFTFRLSNLIVEKQFFTDSSIICLALITTAISLEIAFLFQMECTQRKKREWKLMTTLIYSFGVHLFSIFISLRLDENREQFYVIELILLSVYAVNLMKTILKKALLILIIYAFFSYEWNLFRCYLSESLFYLLIAFLLFINLSFQRKVEQKKKIKKKNEILNVKNPQTTEKTLVNSTDAVGHPLKIHKETPKLKDNFNYGKKQYPDVIINAIKEGIIVFDKQLKIKWRNNIVDKLIIFEEEQDLCDKFLEIKQDEAYLLMHNSFLRSKKQFVHFFKAFQTKINPLKKIYENSNDEVSLLVNSEELKLSISQIIPQSQNYEVSFLNNNDDVEINLVPKTIGIKTVKNFLTEIISSLEGEMGISTSQIFNFHKYNMYGIYKDVELDEPKLFFIRFFPYKNEIVVMLKHMPENDIFIAAMHDTENQNKIFASMCHELRTPLNYITNILEVTQNDLKLKKIDNLHLENVENALMNSKLLISSVNDFLDYFSISANIFNLDKQNFNLKNMILECFQLFSFLAKKRLINYNIQYDDQILEICYNDEKRIKQIILNLLNNAFKYTKVNGSITLQVKKKPTNNLIQIAIIDDGLGIPSQTLKSLGKITADRESNKTTGGFGLCISNHLVNYIGLDNDDRENSNINFNFNETNGIYKGLKVKTLTNLGSKFSFLINENINLATSKESSIMAFENKESDIFSANHTLKYKFLTKSQIKMEEYVCSEKSIEKDFDKFESACKCIKVLGVDDNLFNLLVLKEQFNKYKFSIETANSGDEAIKITNNILLNLNNAGKFFCEKCKFFKLIIMDIDMPVKNGYETTIELKQIFKKFNVESSIVALSAFSQKEAKEKALESGMIEFIEKPLTVTKLEYLINRFIN